MADPSGSNLPGSNPSGSNLSESNLSESKLSKLRALSGREWVLLATALLFLPGLKLALRIWGFRPIYSRIGRRVPLATDTSHPDCELEIADVVRMVDIAARHSIVKATCLPRSLAVWTLLRRRGIESELRIGVRQNDGTFEAHAWVERDGVVLNDSPDVDQRFAAFERVSGVDAWLKFD
jgi:hypothetical protein